MISIAGGGDDSSGTQPRPVFEPSRPGYTEDTDKRRKGRRIQRDGGQQDEEHSIDSPHKAEGNAEQERRGHTARQRVEDGNRSQAQDPYGDAGRMTSGKEEQNQRGQSHERGGAQQASLETDGHHSREGNGQDKFDENPRGRDEKKAPNGQTDGNRNGDIGWRDDSLEGRVTHPADSVWIILNVSIETDCVNEPRGSSA